MSVCDFSAGGQRADSESGGKTSTVDSGMTIKVCTRLNWGLQKGKQYVCK